MVKVKIYCLNLYFVEVIYVLPSWLIWDMWLEWIFYILFYLSDCIIRNSTNATLLNIIYIRITVILRKSLHMQYYFQVIERFYKNSFKFEGSWCTPILEPEDRNRITVWAELVLPKPLTCFVVVVFWQSVKSQGGIYSDLNPKHYLRLNPVSKSYTSTLSKISRFKFPGI